MLTSLLLLVGAGADAGAAPIVRARAVARSRPLAQLEDHSSGDIPKDIRPMTFRYDRQTVPLKRIAIGNAWLAKHYLTIFDPDTNADIPWVDAPSPAVAFCSDPLGETVISGMGPFTLTAVDADAAPGWYHYPVPAAVVDLLEAAGLRGTVVFERVTAGADAELFVVAPRLVTRPRFAA